MGTKYPRLTESGWTSWSPSSSSDHSALGEEQSSRSWSRNAWSDSLAKARKKSLDDLTCVGSNPRGYFFFHALHAAQLEEVARAIDVVVEGDAVSDERGNGVSARKRGDIEETW